VATEAARLKGKTSYREEKEKPTEKEKTDLTLTGLLMEGLRRLVRIGRSHLNEVVEFNPIVVHHAGVVS
jgi:hypothetical protein